MTTIAVLGTGRLGSGFVEAACERGWTVTVWNRTASKAERLASCGALVAASIADAVTGVDRVHLVLNDDTSVEDVLAEAAPALGAGTVICDHTTTQPALTAARAARLAAQGIAYLHCPVFMGPAAARTSAGSMLVSGPHSVFDGVRDELSRMTGRLEYLGERLDHAAAVKLLGNAYIIGIAGLVADVLTLAKGAGLTPDEAIGITGLVNPLAIVQGRGRSMAEGSFEPSFELTMARKDLRLMLETAGELPLGVLPGLAARMDALIAAGHGGEDVGVLALDARR
jgi:3-hydroxyisobutyrate dehydrogenase